MGRETCSGVKRDVEKEGKKWEGRYRQGVRGKRNNDREMGKGEKRGNEKRIGQ